MITAEARIRAYLASGGVGTAYDIAAAVFKAPNTVGQKLAAMYAAGEVRVSGYYRPPKGRAVRIFCAADGKPDARRPKRLGSAAACRKYRKSLKTRLGSELGRAVMRAIEQKASLVVSEGRVIYRRGEGVLVDQLEDAA